MDEESIFAAALEKSSQERTAFLDGVCAADPTLRASVEELLRAHEDAGGFLSPEDAADATVAHEPISEGPGSVIGPYKLLEQIGEGGFGVVFMAEQQRPIIRKVALKIIKPGMDTKEVIARFEAERQALALMDHPNIAKVFDAGSTPSGRPYFVMELVKGVSVTDYCDKMKLATEERLLLFESVCNAIQHAHQKGIIHRDIKPPNVLVTLHDGKPVVKVIDFGIAKAINQRLTERTLFTRFSQLIGTPMYMSPEQAEMSGLDVDTRTDVYSLGVLLYELLTGTTPFDKTRFQAGAAEEILRIIREEDPPRPSTRISTLGNTADDVCAQRRSEPRRLSSALRGELDWIVMKALEKERSRRYETPSELGRDVKRFLDDEPVEACSPSTIHRLRKFARRNKGPVLTVGLVALALMLGMAGTLTGWLRAIDQQYQLEETLAELRETLGEKDRLLGDYRKELTEKALMYAFAGDLPMAIETSEVLKNLDESEAQALMIRGLAEFYAGDMLQSRQHLQEAVELEPDNVSAITILGIIEGYNGDFVSADRHRQMALQMEPRAEYRDYDDFFLAHLMMYYKPAEAVSRLEKLVQRRSSSLMRIQLASALAEKASYVMTATQESLTPEELDRGRAEVEAAIDHVRIVRESTPSNHYVDLTDLVSHCVSVGLDKKAGMADWDRLKPEADRLAAKVESTHSCPVGVAVAAWYYDIVDEPENVDRVMTPIADSGGTRLFLDCERYGRGEYIADASAMSDTGRSAQERIFAAMLSLDDPIERQTVAHVWEKELFENLRESRHAALVLQIPLMLGDEATAMRLSDDILREGVSTYFREGVETQYIEPLLMHLAGRLEDNELLEQAVTAHEASVAHLQIALMRLASDGNREDFRTHLEAASEFFVPWVPETMLARAYRDRLVHDDIWPEWHSGQGVKGGP